MEFDKNNTLHDEENTHATVDDSWRNYRYFKKAGTLLTTVVMIYVVANLVFFPILSNLGLTDTITGEYLTNAILVTILTIFVPTLIFMRGLKTPEFNIRRVSVPMILLSVVMGGALCFAAAGVNGFSQELFSSTGADLTKLISPDPDLTTMGGFMLATICTCFLPAVCEETLFRGALLYSWRGMGKQKVALLTGLLFALLHLSLPGLPALFLIGYMLGLFAFEARSILPCIIMHFMNNFIGVVFSAIGQLDKATAAVEQTTNEVLLASGVFLILGSFVMVVCYRGYKKLCIKQRLDEAHSAGVSLEDELASYNNMPSYTQTFGDVAYQAKVQFPAMPVIISIVTMVSLALIVLRSLYPMV